jgi:hypothetical protein
MLQALSNIATRTLDTSPSPDGVTLTINGVDVAASVRITVLDTPPAVVTFIIEPTCLLSLGSVLIYFKFLVADSIHIIGPWWGFVGALPFFTNSNWLGRVTSTRSSSGYIDPTFE